MDIVDNIIRSMESPIEDDFLRAFIAVARDPIVVSQADAPDLKRWAYWHPQRLFIAAQVRLGKYRADFIAAGAFSNDRMPKVACVECDGAAFHTGPTNRARDRARDEWFRSKGIRTMRFSGKRITRDPYKCAYAVLDYLGAREERGPVAVGWAMVGSFPDMKPVSAASAAFSNDMNFPMGDSE